MFQYDARPKGVMPDKKGDRVPPGAMDERNRQIFSKDAIAAALRSAKLDGAADILDKLDIIDPTKTGWENKTIRVSQILRDAGQDDAAVIAEKIENAKPDVMHAAEAAEGEPHPLNAQQVEDGYNQAFEAGPSGEPSEAAAAFEQAGSAIVEGLEARTAPVTEDEITQAKLAIAVEAGVVLPKEADFADGENPLEGVVVDPKSVEAQTLAAVEGMKAEMQSAVKEVGEALAEGDTDKATNIAENLFSRMEKAGVETMPDELKEMYAGVKENLSAAIKEKNPEAKSKLFKFACGAADFIPVVGPAKMLLEAAAGKTLGGDKLSGWKRFLHGAEGAVFLAIDLTGYGAVATKLAKAGKSGAMAAKLLTRSAAFMRVLKVPRGVYKPVFNAGMFLLRHPRLGKLATRGLTSIMKGRKMRMVKELPGVLRPKAGETAQPDDITPEAVANPTQRDGAELEATPPDYELQNPTEAAAA